MKNKKLISMTASLAIVAVIGIGATLAYLSDAADPKTNIFTMGKVDIELTETGCIAEGLEESGLGTVTPSEDGSGYEYKDLLPGFKGVKKPVVTVKEGSVESYVFVSISGIDSLEKEGVKFDSINSDWIRIDPDTGMVINSEGKDGVLRYKDTVNTLDGKAKTLTELFTEVSIDPAIKEFSEVDLGEVVIRASAIQSGGFYGPEAAYRAYKEQIVNP